VRLEPPRRGHARAVHREPRGEQLAFPHERQRRSECVRSRPAPIHMCQSTTMLPKQCCHDTRGGGSSPSSQRWRS
jgi:hypothetical protein